MSQQIVAIPSLKDNYIWAIKHQENVVIVDPGEAAPVQSFLNQQNLTLKAILLTHHHWDHVNAAPDLSREYNIPIFGPVNDNIPFLTYRLEEGAEVRIEDFPLSLRVLDIPGHTLGHIAYTDDAILFCGDTLFSAGCGRLFEGTASQLYHSLQKLAALPAHTHVYCGHEYTLNNLRFAACVEPDNSDIAERIKHVSALRNSNQPTLPSTIQEELKTNPFLRCDEQGIIASVSQHSGKTLRTPVEVFAELRKWKDQF